MLARRRQWFHRVKIHTGAAVANWGLRKAAASHSFGSAQDKLHSKWARPSAELTRSQDANDALSKGSALEDIRMGTLAARFLDLLSAFATINRQGAG